MTPASTIDTIEALEALYGEPGHASLAKEVARLTPAYRALIEASPFVLVATSGPDGLDCSPRGDQPGFVAVADETTLILPDRRGNNRLDTLRNIIHDPRVALLFMIPGTNETLRVNGRAVLTADPGLRAQYAAFGKEPATLAVITIETVYFQCARALVRSNLWDPNAQRPRNTLPSPGDMLADGLAGFDGAAYDAALPERQRTTLY